VIGASGDLAKKKTYPALFELWKANLLPSATTIRGFARTPNSHQQLRSHIKYVSSRILKYMRFVFPSNNSLCRCSLDFSTTP
jgi:glucose-6-phosphate 1-dehydrogenase